MDYKKYIDDINNQQEHFINESPIITDNNFVVDDRTIINLGTEDVFVKNDLNSVILSFKLNRYFNNIDLSLKQLKVNYINAKNQSSSVIINNIENTSEIIMFKWTVSNNVTVSKGIIYFSLEFSEKNSQGDIIYRWSTKPLSLNVSDTIVVLNDTNPIDINKELEYYNENINNIHLNILDDKPPINIINRKVIDIEKLKDLVVEQDHNSQLITFKINRYFNNEDLSNKVIDIKYINADHKSDRIRAINILVEDTFITFAWLLNKNVTIKSGVVYFSIEILGYSSDNAFYIWQTTPSNIVIENGIVVDEIIFNNLNPSWIQQMEVDMYSLNNNFNNLLILIGNLNSDLESILKGGG